jgi:CubicO group peptidase (beta-lactamase class C family)
MTCTCLYISDRQLSTIKEQDLAISPLNLVSIEIDNKNKVVYADLFGLGKEKAVYKDGLGCTLIHGEKDDYDISFKNERPFLTWNDDQLPYPYGRKDTIMRTSNIDMLKIEEALELAFDESGAYEKQTRAIVILHKDTLVAEKYAEGFTAETPILGWSMTKSITNALIGILVGQGKLSVHEPPKIKEWEDDPKRSKITLDNLLRMNSGLFWEEDYTAVTTVTKMLFNSASVVETAVNQDAEFTQGTNWEYSSGTTNIISGIIRKLFDTHLEYLAFPYIELFVKLDMASAQLETDEAGNYVLSSYCTATPRDWAKLGLLYINDGVWKDERILPEGWVDYSITPTPVSKNLKYGAQIWLNTNKNYFPDAPEDLYFFSGFQGQHVIIIPSKELVIVKMGLKNAEEFDMNSVIKTIAAAIK